MSSRSLVLIASALVLVVGAAAITSAWPRIADGQATTLVSQIPAAPPAAQPAPVLVAAASAPVVREVPQGQGQVQLSFAPVVKEVAPAVVNVYATTITKQSGSPFADDPFFGRLFGQNG